MRTRREASSGLEGAASGECKTNASSPATDANIMTKRSLLSLDYLNFLHNKLIFKYRTETEGPLVGAPRHFIHVAEKDC